MNLQNLNFDYVERPHPLGQPAAAPRTPSTPSDQSQVTLRPLVRQAQHDEEEEYASSSPAPPSLPTVVPRAPSPPSPSSSGTDIYGPDRLFSTPQVRPNNGFGPVRSKPLLSAAEIQRIALEVAITGQLATGMGYKDEMAFEAGKVTPGVDDTPYIQYALEVLTRDRDTGVSYDTSSSANDQNPLHQYIPDRGLNYYKPPPPQAFRPPVQQAEPVRHRGEQRADEPRPARPLAAFDPHRPSPNSSLSTLVPQPKTLLPPFYPKDSWGLVDRERFGRDRKMMHPRLDFKPRILRTPSMMALMILCFLMMTGLIFSAAWSRSRSGLVAYGGTIYSGQYFVFRILPQLLAAVIHMYAQAVTMAVSRISPFARMEATTNRDPSQRYGALFQDLYPKSLFWPHLIGTWHTWVPMLVTWVAIIALPLQSSLFTVILVDGTWRWATVQGVAWTLAVLYMALLASTGILFWYWRNRKTGLLWDPRSIADIAAIVTSSNTLSDYRGTELMATKGELVAALSRRAVDKLGYWCWNDQRNTRIWHTIASDVHDERWLDRNAPSVQAADEAGEKHGYHADVEASPHSAQVRYRYLPWCLRDAQIFYFAGMAFVLLVTLLILSFLPATNIRRGFVPGVSAAPVAGAFSAADFLYSFVPSLLGLIMFLLFQSLELSLRVLQPWAELAQGVRSADGGARPEPSILADYAACLPLQATQHAFRNGHWRVAAASFLSLLFILLPTLGGGLFIALTLPSGEVRMVPNVPLYAVVVALLVVYFLALAAMLPGRKAFRLPHAVGCLAEVVSFCANDDLAADEAFKDARARTVLRGKIGVDRAPQMQPRWLFGVGTGPDGRLGIRRARRYTEMEKRQSRRQRRQQQQQQQEQRLHQQQQQQPMMI